MPASTMSEHPSDNVLRLFVNDQLAKQDYDRVNAHVSTCVDCRDRAEYFYRAQQQVEHDPALRMAHLLAERAPNQRRSDPAQIPDASQVTPPEIGNSLPPSIGGYRVVKQLGAGTFGVVYLAHDETLNRPLAIKVARRERIRTLGGNDLYLKEARALAQLDHPNIVKVFLASPTDDGSFFIVSEYIEGCSLGTRMDQGRLNFVKAAKIVASVADALQHAHENGLYHRDVKPHNILLDTRDKPYLVDFGLALKDADMGRGPQQPGTPAYMSPEQARGEGHRVEGRSDVFSLGVVFYEMLTGKRLFTAGSQKELLDRIAHCDAPSARQRDRKIPPELDRICAKALSRQLCDRYRSASEFADDLRVWLDADGATAPQPEPTPVSRTPTPPTPTPELVISPAPLIPIVPKGLDSFDAGDEGYFLKLIPGPRDRDGLPPSIQFWKQRIEETNSENTFAVGLLYGPSGCGKSSLVKAGLLPRLASHIVQIHVEATATGTEAKLLRRLHNEFPSLTPNLNLIDSLAALRHGHGLQPGQKVLLVVDQFEQWLHAQRTEDDVELVRGLRQCDGGRVQTLVLVREDFWPKVRRFFFDRLEIPIEPRNSRTVELFDERHAHKVLKAFGQAYDALPDDDDSFTPDHRRFLDQAVETLAKEGQVIPVRLSVFAQTIKGKAWTPALLKRYGGAEGVGVAFLEESFDVLPHRSHQRAAQAVLKRLLPEIGTDIRGQMRPQEELLRISGYDYRRREFDELLRILDSELRLITPTEPDTNSGSESEATGHGPDFQQGQRTNESGIRFYQLTHDYLVPELRTWLTRKQEETRRGRAELRLAKLAALWNTSSESRHLPAWWEWLNIRLLTSPKDWTPTQRKMMGKAKFQLGIRAVLSGMLLLAVGTVIWFSRKYQAQKLVNALLEDSTKLRETTELIAKIRVLNESGLRLWANTALKNEIPNPEDRKREVIARLLLLPVDDQQASPLFKLLHPDKNLDDLLDATTFEETCWTLAKLAPEDAAQEELKRLTDEKTKVLLEWHHDDEDKVVYEKKLKNRIRHGQLRAAVAIALMRHQKSAEALSILQTRDDPEAMTQFCAHCKAGDVKPSHLIQALEVEKKRVSINAPTEVLVGLPSSGTEPKQQFANLRRFTLLMALGEYSIGELPVAEQAPFKTQLKEWFEKDKSSAIHGVTGWLLRLPRWEFGDTADRIEHDIAEVSVPKVLNKEWFVIKVNADQGETVCFTFIVFKRGQFEMGSPRHENFRFADDRELRHQVTLTHKFAICDREVTCQQFDQFQPVPAEKLNPKMSKVPKAMHWHEGVKYCNWLTEKLFPGELDKCCYDKELAPVTPSFFEKPGFRLPTDAEWEYACRSGTRTPYGFGSDHTLIKDYGWTPALDNLDRGGTVGRLRPNLRGVFDLHGNALEWCSDRWKENIDFLNKDPFWFHEAVNYLERRIMRGGAWQHPNNARSAGRYWQGLGGSKYGMRLVLTLDVGPSDSEN